MFAVDNGPDAACLGDLVNRIGQTVTQVHARGRGTIPSDKTSHPDSRFGVEVALNTILRNRFLCVPRVLCGGELLTELQHLQAGGGSPDGPGHVQLVSRFRTRAREHLSTLGRARTVTSSTRGPSVLCEVPADDSHAVFDGQGDQAGDHLVRSRRLGVHAEAPATAAPARGVAPIAARSLRLTASARWPMAAGGVKRPIEVDAFDDGVNAQHLEPVPRRLDNRRIVADADQQPVGGSWQAAGCAR